MVVGLGFAYRGLNNWDSFFFSGGTGGLGFRVWPVYLIGTAWCI